MYCSYANLNGGFGVLLVPPGLDKPGWQLSSSLPETAFANNSNLPPTSNRSVQWSPW